MNKRIKTAIFFILGALFLIGALIPFFLPEPVQLDPVFGKNRSNYEYMQAVSVFTPEPFFNGSCLDQPDVTLDNYLFVQESSGERCYLWDKRQLDYYLSCVEKNGTEVIDHCGSLSVPIK